MTEDINKAYIQKYVTQAETTNNQAVRNDALYRVGSHMEVIACDGNTNLTPNQQETILNAAKQALGNS